MPHSRVSSDPWSNPRVMKLILEEARTVAVVGIVDKPTHPSFEVARFLIENGYRVVGINPKLDEVLGTLCYPSLSDVPEPIDVVDVFQNKRSIGTVIDEVIKLRIPFLWLQEGIVEVEGAQKALEAGVKVVMDHCIAKELSNQRLS